MQASATDVLGLPMRNILIIPLVFELGAAQAPDETLTLACVRAQRLPSGAARVSPPKW